MLVQNWKRKIVRSSSALILVGAFAATQIAAASGINDAGLDSLGITDVQYDAAKESAKESYNAEMVALGWATAAEAADANEDDKWVRVGRGQYYKVLDKDDFVADALGVSDAAFEQAEEASYSAKLAEKVADGDMTAEEAANKQAIHDFKDGIDKDVVLAQAMGISVADLNAARASNTEYSELLDSLGLTNDDVRTASREIMTGLVETAVSDGTLTAEQGEQAQSRRGRSGRGGGRSRGGNAPAGGQQARGGGGNVQAAPNAQAEEPVGSYSN